MKLASHDSMTYLKPKKWYMYPFKFMARCLSKTIKEQYEDYGIRYFDLRIRYNNETTPEFAHGIMVYKGNVREVLEYLNSKGEEVWIRFILEVDGGEEWFIMDCKNFEEQYPNLKFHCGRRKSDWKVLYKFKNEEPSLDQKISSMTWKIWDDWFPYLYAKHMNHKNIEQGTDKDYLMIDFLHIQ